MKILSIETSCDETAVAIVENGRKIIASTVASSKELHEKTGGIIPEAAAREQVKCIIPVIEEVLRQKAKNKEQRTKNIKQNRLKLLSDIDAIAVTVGPGLIGSLLVGVETAKTIAYVTKKPIIPVNHVLAHIYANWLLESDKDTSGVTRRSSPDGEGIRFPAIALVVSGGHTELFLMKRHGSLKWLGGTRDDAAGEAFDKTARLLGLGYPGGPAIAACATKLKTKNLELRTKIKLPRPMINSDDLNFSFSGLKTAVIREINKLKILKKLNDEMTQQLAYEIQEAITDVLVEKTLRAAKQYKVKSILLGGGVAANKRLREKFQFSILNSQFSIPIYIPPPHLCTDNASYIASYAYFNCEPVSWQKIQAIPSLEVEV